ncbi:MAG: hypothetical protein IPG32_00135 [Saprospirales bacterium]|nr:hypothetical protein [Saprospirales bacterium]
MQAEKKRKQEEYEENKWKGYRSCRLVITKIECIDQDDYTGSDRLWIYGFPNNNRDYFEEEIYISSGETKILDLEVQFIDDCQGDVYLYIEEVDIFGYGEIDDEIARLTKVSKSTILTLSILKSLKNENEGIHYKVGLKVVPRK